VVLVQSRGEQREEDASSFHTLGFRLVGRGEATRYYLTFGFTARQYTSLRMVLLLVASWTKRSGP
jgi:hypothetical protein